MLTRSRRTTRLIAAASAGLGLTAALILVARESVAAKIAVVAGFVISAITLLHDVWTARAEQRSPGLERLADELAEVVETQWTEEGRSRGLHSGAVLPISWTNDRLRDAPVRGRLAGNFDESARDLAGEYLRVHPGRSVVVGEPGAGKTVLALLLTAGLARRRTAEGATPVLLSASGWDPVVERFDDWVVQATATVYYGGRIDVPRRLWENNLLIPIVDGLDEIPETSRRQAVRAVNRAIGATRRVVLTCRANEYDDLILGGSPALSRAPVIRVRPVALADAEKYMTDRTATGDPGWPTVFERVRAGRAEPLALAFSTPLIVTLAREVYDKLDRDPRELLAEAEFPTRHAVEDHLVGLIVEAAYGPAGADRALRSLSFLARRLHLGRQRELAWWLLPEQLVSRWALSGLGLVAGILTMLTAAVTVPLIDGDQRITPLQSSFFAAGTGLAYAMVATLLWSSAGGRTPSRLSFRLRGAGPRVRRGFRLGALFGSAPSALGLLAYALGITVSGYWSFANVERFGLAVAAALALTVVAGSVFAALGWTEGADQRAAPVDPVDLLRRDRRSSIAAAAIGGTTAAVLVWPVLVLLLWTASEVAGVLTGWAGWPGRPAPTDILAARRADLASWTFGSPRILVAGLVVLPGLIVSSFILVARPWPRYLAVCLLMAAGRRLPLRLTAFLEDACRRHVLRRSGGSYQFRHARLQEQLVDAGRSGPDPTPGPRWAWAAAGRRRPIAVLTAVALLGAVVVVAMPRADRAVTVAGDYGRGPYYVAFSSTGRRLVVGSTDDPVMRILDSRGALVASLPGQPGGASVENVVFSPDETKVAVWFAPPGGVSRAHVWDIDQRRLVIDTVVDSSQWEQWVAFSADSESVAFVVPPGSGRVPGVDLWSLSTGRRIASVSGAGRRAPGFGSDGSSFVVFDSRRASLRAMSDGREIAALGVVSPALDEPVTYAPDGRSIAVTGADTGTSIRDSRSGRLIAEQPTTGDPPDDADTGYVRFTANSRFAALRGEQTVRLVDLRSRTVVGRIATGSPIADFDIDPVTAAVYLVEADGRIYDFTRTGHPGMLRAATGTGAAVATGVRVTDGGRYVTSLRSAGEVGGDKAIQVWSPTTGRRLSEVPGSDLSVQQIDTGTSTTMQVTGDHGESRFFAKATGALTFTLPEASEPTTSDLSGDRALILTGSEENPDRYLSLAIFDVVTGRKLRRVDDLRGYVNLPGTAVGSVVVTGQADGVMRLWSVDSGRLMAEFAGHAGDLVDAAISPDGRRLATSAGDGTVRLWDLPPR